MKLIVALALMLSTTLTAGEFEAGLGGSIGIRNAGNGLLVSPAIGSTNFKFNLTFGIGANSILLRPGLLVDLPYSVYEEKLFVGPTFDLGPSFGFGGGITAISPMDIGIGCKLRYMFDENIGVGFIPVHLSMAFAQWGSGGIGFVTGFALAYDLMASFIYNWG